MIDETHFYKPPTPLNSNRLSYEEGWKDAEAHIIKLLDEFIENCDLPEVADRFEWFKDALINGEK